MFDLLNNNTLLKVGLRVWSGGEIFSKKINKKWRSHKAPPPIITKVKDKIQVEKCRAPYTNRKKKKKYLNERMKCQFILLGCACPSLLLSLSYLYLRLFLFLFLIFFYCIFQINLISITFNQNIIAHFRPCFS